MLAALRQTIFALIIATATLGPAFAEKVWVQNVSGNRFYTVQPLITRAFVYSDREFVFGNPPSCLFSRQYLLTANADKFTQGDRLVELQADENMVTYIGYDSRYNSQPPWLTSRFTRTRERISVVNLKDNRPILTFELWRSQSPSRTIILGGNLAAGEKANNSMYTAFFVPERSSGPSCPF